MQEVYDHYFEGPENVHGDKTLWFSSIRWQCICLILYDTIASRKDSLKLLQPN